MAARPELAGPPCHPPDPAGSRPRARNRAWPVTRRRREPVGEPLFGEDWWVADQKLFEESLFRQQDSPPAPRPAVAAAR